MSGYSIMQWIDEKTEGAWKPGPGTMYPLLRVLQWEGLVKPEGGRGKGATKTYRLSPKGTRKLEELRSMIAGAGRKERVMIQLFSELLPGTVFVPMMVKRWREGMDVFRLKVAEMPEEQRTPVLEELRLVLKSQLDWVDSTLASGVRGSPGHKDTEKKR